ncbi:MAG TPA: CHAT domain-containing protein, partial [Myxococcaceae bacterium]|nr:CHAT domain-containing protein [Myxococcaceae bacterium]
TLTLELIRHGPPHNQLLSELTQYLALCDNGVAETIRLPFNHHDFLVRSMSLRYESGGTNLAQLREMGRQLGSILAAIQGLGAASAGTGSQDASELLHLRLVISAAELALLPFEAALAPNGFPGAGLSLSLQTVLPVTITRQVRGMNTRASRWSNEPPRVLLVSADPSGRGLPLEDHRRVMEKALAPWKSPRSWWEPIDAEIRLDEIQNASVEAIRDACAKRSYTHVHILAHGKGRPVAGGERFCLALCDNNGDEALVDGEQLASALRAHTPKGLSSPTVVTIAACDSGNAGSVIAPGSSLAHTLHESGIPLVLGSQFPLTCEGSVVMTQVFYSQLFWGKDPRVALHDVRLQLRQLRGHEHDWASLVVYAAFPANFEQQLREAQILQARRAANAALARMGDVLTPPSGNAALVGQKAYHAMMEEEVATALRVLEDSVPPEGTRDFHLSRGEISGLCGSIEKRRAEVQRGKARALMQLSEGRPGTAAELEALGKNFERALRKSREHYYAGFQANLANHWAATQCLFLDTLLEGSFDAEVFTVAHLGARQDAHKMDLQSRAWAHGTLVELELLRSITNPGAASEAEKDAKRHVEALIRLRGADSFEVFSTRRQLEWYVQWSQPPFGRLLKGVEKWPHMPEVARRVAEAFGTAGLPQVN